MTTTRQTAKNLKDLAASEARGVLKTAKKTDDVKTSLLLAAFANHESGIETKIESSVRSIVPQVIREVVNGKIDKLSTTLSWIRAIFFFSAPFIIALFAWSLLWEVNTSNQVAGVAAAINILTHQVTAPSSIVK